LVISFAPRTPRFRFPVILKPCLGSLGLKSPVKLAPLPVLAFFNPIP